MRESTWTNIGTDVMATSVEEALKQSNLNYNVVKHPVYAKVGDSDIVLPNCVATVREDTNEVFGIVSDRYEICQNEEAFNFVDSMDINIVKAGQTHTGMIYLIGKLPDVTVLRDTFTPYLIFQNGHNGFYTVKTTICPLRIVCQNQFNIAFKQSPNTISIQHSKQYAKKLAEAEKVIKSAVEYMGNFNDTAEELAMLKIGDDSNVHEIINAFFTLDDDLSDRQCKAVMEKREQLFTAYKADDNANFVGTAWGLINGFSDYITHKETKNTKNKDENKFMTVTFDPRIFKAFINHVSNYT